MNLAYLNIRFTQVTEEGVKKLQKALPNCREIGGNREIGEIGDSHLFTNREIGDCPLLFYCSYCLGNGSLLRPRPLLSCPVRPLPRPRPDRVRRRGYKPVRVCRRLAIESG